MECIKRPETCPYFMFIVYYIGHQRSLLTPNSRYWGDGTWTQNVYLRRHKPVSSRQQPQWEYLTTYTCESVQRKGI